MKYPRASGVLRQAPDPMLKRAHFTRMTLLRTIGNLGLSRSGPPQSNPGSAPVMPVNLMCDPYSLIDLLLAVHVHEHAHWLRQWTIDFRLKC